MVESFNSRDVYQAVGQDNALRAVVVEAALSVDASFSAGNQESMTAVGLLLISVLMIKLNIVSKLYM